MGLALPSRRAFFSPTSRGKFLDLRPALDRAQRAAHDRRVFCERTPAGSERKKRRNKSYKIKKIDLRSYSTGHAPRPPTAQPGP